MGGWTPAHQCLQLVVTEVLWGAEVAVVLLVWELMLLYSAVTRVAAAALQRGQLELEAGLVEAAVPAEVLESASEGDA